MTPRQIILPLVVFGGLSFLIVRDWLKPVVPPGYDGYIEAEDTYLSAPQPAHLLTRPVGRGDRVQPGDIVFTLDSAAGKAAVSEAKARLAMAESQYRDATLGARPDELASWAAQQKSAAANVALAEIQLKRAQQLAATRAGTPAAVDEATARLKSAQAEAERIEAQIRLANLGQRADQQAALAEARKQADAAFSAAQHSLDLMTGHAPIAGRVIETYYEIGEFVPAGSPVVAIRPASALKVRFFIPQSDIPKMAAGTKVSIGCDGCKQAIPGHVSFVNDKVEYTPPVIYSQGQRDRLVMLVEAVPDDPAAFMAAGFNPGQPIRITP